MHKLNIKERFINLPSATAILIFLSVVVIMFSFAVYSLASWQAPTQAPTDGNADPPINVSGNVQYKTGPLGIGGVFETDTNTHLAINGGNVGIGTATPGARLHVNGDILLDQSLRMSGGTGNNTVLWVHQGNDRSISYLTAGSSQFTNDIRVYGNDDNTSANRIYFRTSGSNRMIVLENGTVQIDNPASGNPTMIMGRVSGQPTIQASGGWFIADSAGTGAGLNYWSSDNVILANGGGNVGIGTTNPNERLHVSGNMNLTGGLIFPQSPQGEINYSSSNDYIYIRRPGVTSRVRFWPNTGQAYFAGRVGIGTTSPGAQLHIEGANGARIAQFRGRSQGETSNTFYFAAARNEGLTSSRWHPALMIRTGGDRWFHFAADSTDGGSFKMRVHGDVTSGAFFYASDRSLKENIKPISGALDKILKLQGTNFDWKSSGEKSIGFIAQDVEKIFPEAVNEDSEGVRTVNYGPLVAPIVEAIKELHKENQELRDKYQELEKRVEALENK